MTSTRLPTLSLSLLLSLAIRRYELPDMPDEPLIVPLWPACDVPLVVPEVDPVPLPVDPALVPVDPVPLPVVPAVEPVEDPLPLVVPDVEP
jgi:hypothetical protein